MRWRKEPTLAERVLIVGYGSIGQRHLRLVRKALPSADIRVLRRSSGSAPINGVQAVYAQLQEALNFAPQLAVVASPASEHLCAATALVAQGCHVLIEKPLCLPGDSASDLISACRHQPGVCVQVGYNLRFLSSLQRFRQLIGEKKLGKVLSVRCEVGQYLPNWRPGQDYRSSASAQRALGGGVLMELSHELDYLQWVFGRCEWVSAFLGQCSALEIDVEDTALLWLGHASEGGQAGPVTALCMDFYRHDTTRRCTAICEQGSITWDAVAGRVELRRAGVDVAELVLQDVPARDETYIAQWQNFSQSAAGMGSSAVTLSDALSIVALIRAAHQSANAASARVAVPAQEVL
jgi:predicted dehydrogenase